MTTKQAIHKASSLLVQCDKMLAGIDALPALSFKRYCPMSGNMHKHQAKDNIQIARAMISSYIHYKSTE